MIDGTVLMILIVLSKFIIFAIKQALFKIKKKIRAQRVTLVQFSRGGRTAMFMLRRIKKFQRILWRMGPNLGSS